MILCFDDIYMAEVNPVDMIDKLMIEAIHMRGYNYADLLDKNDNIIATIANDVVTWNKPFMCEYPYFLYCDGDILYSHVYGFDKPNRLFFKS